MDEHELSVLKGSYIVKSEPDEGEQPTPPLSRAATLGLYGTIKGSKDNSDHSSGNSPGENSGYWSITCADCRTTATTFEDRAGKHWYLCCYCADTDLCEACYNTRERRHGVDTPGTKERIEACPRGHGHFRGPIEGWKGVDDSGVVRYGNVEIEGQDWLTRLKKKWKQCWDEYWL
ncbi:hypothetical protein B0T24DRAFT_20990 [Lasiosphaeria ovina]|uniref:ZZ-type domain-containing protein n=1 Tax=Lasiosphaeria ovina TaxID=92902 RepID=A0AAE0NJS7_9PEZI|nr:hypothetical protein B0T24DRAFT_20990 [Lasiosphaeria ovina]